eukprot:177686-Alexandrium_andersonii.AAC.1
MRHRRLLELLAGSCRPDSWPPWTSFSERVGGCRAARAGRPRTNTGERRREYVSERASEERRDGGGE